MRIIRQPLKLFAEFEASSADIGIFPHPDRNTGSKELATCADFGLADANVIRAECAAHAADDFGDNKVGLFESSIVFKNLTSPRLHAAMEHCEWSFQHFRTRDQLSLPCIIWKHGLIVHKMTGSSRRAHDNFHFFPPIKGEGRIPLSIVIKARLRVRAMFRLFPLGFLISCVRIISKILR